MVRVWVRVTVGARVMVGLVTQIAKLHWPNDGSHWLHLAVACQQWANEVYWLASHTGLPMSCHRVAS